MSQNNLYIRAKELIEELLLQADTFLNDHNNVVVPNSISTEESEKLDIIIDTCEQRKAVLTVLITLLSYKIVAPAQDIRKHQANMKGGFSGRTFDTQIITPFMKKNGFPAMVESGWLTRSLEQNRPYNLNFPGKITPKKTKTAFLEILNYIEKENASANDYLIYLFQKLIIYREEHKVHLIVQPLKDKKVSIQEIIFILDKHFKLCSEVGKARLPVLAIYAIYECIVEELNRYNLKKLQNLESHTSADVRSGEIGDVDVLNEDNTPFEGVEIKYGKPITAQMIKDAYEKFKIYPVSRYYLLSTVYSSKEEMVEIEKVIADISKEHGCQVIVNGLLQTVKYYLRLINDTDKFIEKYAHYVEIDDVIKLEHKRIWNELVSK